MIKKMAVLRLQLWCFLPRLGFFVCSYMYNTITYKGKAVLYNRFCSCILL